MATAPRPGTTPSSAASKRKAIRIRYFGDEYVLDFGDLGPRDDIATRRATGMPVSSFVGRDVFAADSIAVLVWLARRKAGETETFDAFLSGFPTMLGMAAAVESGDIVVTALEDDAEVDDDPLDHAAG